MNLLKRNKDRFTFHLPKREKPLLLAVLGQYPLIPPAHQRLSKSSTAGEPNQRLLDEALADQRREHKRRLNTWLKDEQRFQEARTGCQMVLTASEIEWLLQVLNDVRVGSWILLGAPEKDVWDFELNETTAPYGWAMEMAGRFEAALLEGLEQDTTH